LTEILKQEQYSPMSVGEQVAIIYAGVNDLIDGVPVDQVKNFEKELIQMLRDQHFDFLEQLSQEIKPEAEEKLKRLVDTLKQRKGYAALASK
jgi:F-type H+-transporting ATPase subunit alpha